MGKQAEGGRAALPRLATLSAPAGPNSEVPGDAACLSRHVHSAWPNDGPPPNLLKPTTDITAITTSTTTFVIAECTQDVLVALLMATALVQPS